MGGTSIVLFKGPFATADHQPVTLQKLETIRRGRIAVRISPDSHWLAAANAHPSAVRLWDLTADGALGKPVTVDLSKASDDAMTRHQYINDLAFSPDSRALALVQNSEGAKGVTWIWDLSAAPGAGRAPIPLRGHEGYITGLEFSPDGRRLATGSADVSGVDNTIRVWDLAALETSLLPIVFRGNPGGVSALAFAADGRWLFSGSLDGTLQRWPLNTEDLLNRARETVGRNLTSQEWSQYFVGQPYRKTFEALP